MQYRESVKYCLSDCLVKWGFYMNIAYFLLPKGRVAYLRDDFTFRQGLEKMRHYGYTAIAVITRSGQYAGTVREGDFLWPLLGELPGSSAPEPFPHSTNVKTSPRSPDGKTSSRSTDGKTPLHSANGKTPLHSPDGKTPLHSPDDEMSTRSTDGKTPLRSPDMETPLRLRSARELERFHIRDILRPDQYPPVRITVPMEELLKFAHQEFVPVTDDMDRFIGIVTQQDILRCLMPAQNALQTPLQPPDLPYPPIPHDSKLRFYA